jgi:hypothetical protein
LKKMLFAKMTLKLCFCWEKKDVLPFGKRFWIFAGMA